MGADNVVNQCVGVHLGTHIALTPEDGMADVQVVLVEIPTDINEAIGNGLNVEVIDGEIPHAAFEGTGDMAIEVRTRSVLVRHLN